MAAVRVESNITTEKQAVSTIADFARNPPKNPVDVVRFVAKNMTVSADVSNAVASMLGSTVGKALPIAGAIFEIFTSFTAPSIGEQIASAVQQISSAIQAGVEEIKNALEFSTEKTVSAVLDEVENVSMEESAARVIEALAESEILAATNAEIAELYEDYTEQVTALNQEWQDEINAALRDAQARVSQVYAKIQDILAALGIDLMAELQKLLEEKSAAHAAAQESRATPAPVLARKPAENNMMPVILLGAGAAAFFWWQSSNRKKS